MMSENIFRDPAFARFLMSMGAGMMGQPTLGKGLTSGMQAGVMSYMNDMTDEEKRKHQQQLLKDEQQGRLSLMNTEYGYKNQAAQDEASSKQERLKIAGSAIAAQAEKSGVEFSPLFKAALEAGDETAIKSGQDAIDRNEKAKIDVTVKGMDRAADSSEFDRRFSIQNPGGIETPEQKAAREQALWLSRNAITDTQQTKRQLEQDRMAREAWMQQNDFSRNQAKNDAAMAASDKKSSDANDTLSILEEVKKILPTATSSLVGSKVDQGLAAVGLSTSGADASTQLKILGNSLVMKVPRMQGPQSDKDVQLYKEAAGNIGDETKPISQRMAAVSTIEKLNKKYATVNSSTGGARPGYVPFRMGK
jgi:hypothetical protein